MDRQLELVVHEGVAAQTKSSVVVDCGTEVPTASTTTAASSLLSKENVVTDTSTVTRDGDDDSSVVVGGNVAGVAGCITETDGGSSSSEEKKLAEVTDTTTTTNDHHHNNRKTGMSSDNNNTASITNTTTTITDVVVSTTITSPVVTTFTTDNNNSTNTTTTTNDNPLSSKTTTRPILCSRGDEDKDGNDNNKYNSSSTSTTSTKTESNTPPLQQQCTPKGSAVVVVTEVGLKESQVGEGKKNEKSNNISTDSGVGKMEKTVIINTTTTTGGGSKMDDETGTPSGSSAVVGTGGDVREKPPEGSLPSLMDCGGLQASQAAQHQQQHCQSQQPTVVVNNPPSSASSSSNCRSTLVIVGQQHPAQNNKTTTNDNTNKMSAEEVVVIAKKENEGTAGLIERQLAPPTTTCPPQQTVGAVLPPLVTTTPSTSLSTTTVTTTPITTVTIGGSASEQPPPPLQQVGLTSHYQQHQIDQQAGIPEDGSHYKVSSKNEQLAGQSAAAATVISAAAATTPSSGETTVDNSMEVNLMERIDSSTSKKNEIPASQDDKNPVDSFRTSLDSLSFADDLELDNVPGSRKQTVGVEGNPSKETNSGGSVKNQNVESSCNKTDSCFTIDSSSSKQPLEKVEDGWRVISTSPDHSQTRQGLKNSSGIDVGANIKTTVEHNNQNREPSNLPCNPSQGIKFELSLPQDESDAAPTATETASASCEVPKRSERVISKTSLSLGDHPARETTDDHSSKRSDTDSQDVTPSDSMSIPSDRDLECVEGISLEAADNDNGPASSKVTKDGTSSLSSSSVQSIYHLKWIHFKSKTIPVITQNENGPCPLLAIMNVLLLQGRVTLESGLELITSEQLMDHLGECILENVPKTASEDIQLNYQQNMQDGMAVVHKLQTGLDVNVGFTGVQDFEYTPEYIIFDLLGISLYHGWLVDPQSHEVVSAIGKCSYNQLVEKIIVQKNSDSNEQITEALIAENFLEKTASQLTYHGLCELSTTVKEGELCVFFRNNHFSTLYRHKNELFLLVTDQGFLTECNVVWETLSSVEGDCYFVDAEFNTYTKPDLASSAAVVTPPVVPIGSDQQIDQDYLVALSLDREQQLQREVWASQAGGPGVGGNGGRTGTGGGGGVGGGGGAIDPHRGHHVQLSDLELAKKLQDEENQRANVAAATASNRRARTAMGACGVTPPSSSGNRRSREREKEKDSCTIL